jgi:hypothetical protein
MDITPLLRRAPSAVALYRALRALYEPWVATSQLRPPPARPSDGYPDCPGKDEAVAPPVAADTDIPHLCHHVDALQHFMLF